MGKLGVALKLRGGFANFVGDGLLHNNIFDLNSPQNRDNCYAPFYLLKRSFAEVGVELNTADVNQTNKLLFELHMDVQPRINNIPMYVLLYETPQIKPVNQCKDYIIKYRRVFTWNDDLVDGKHYIKINIPNDITVNQSRGWEGRDRICCMIAGNKTVCQTSLHELYSERVRAIRWFEQHAPHDFDLFGVGWNLCVPRQGLLGRVVNKLSKQVVIKTGYIPFPSYRGKVVSKLETYQKYRFSICYENVRDLPGYITEKIFDSFFAGCVPVYWGASNISTYVPENCFIDRRKFNSYEKLYQFMVSMTEQDYISYQERIAAFLTSEQAIPFSMEAFTETIINTIVSDLGITA